MVAINSLETFPVTNGTGSFVKTLNGSTIKIDYEFEALSGQHYFTIENNVHTTRKARGTTGGVLNRDGWLLCDLFVVLHSVFMCGMEGYVEELPAGTIQLRIMNKEGVEQWLEGIAKGA